MSNQVHSSNDSTHCEVEELHSKSYHTCDSWVLNSSPSPTNEAYLLLKAKKKEAERAEVTFITI